jgi:hypothetical protein
MEWEILDTNYISNLLEQVYNENDTKLVYIKEKAKRRGFEYLTLSEYNYVRSKNDLQLISIKKIEKILFETVITFSDINKETGISRITLYDLYYKNKGSKKWNIKQIEEYFGSQETIE